MCGIAGILGFPKGQTQDDLTGPILKQLRHRGPDSSGVLNLENGQLLHTRLAVIDPKPASNQPFIKDGSSIVFNGEIYNYRELKSYLSSRGRSFITNSDTEVLLEGILEEGSDFLIRLRGMFAFVMWDNKRKIFFGARDRFGEKPLYIAMSDDKLLFASEFRCLRSMLGGQIHLNYEAINLFLHYQFMPESISIDSRIQKLKPGSFVIFNPNDGKLSIESYFRIQSSIRSAFPRENSNKLDPRVIRDVKDLLIQAVERCLVADVPVAFALSGGIDSSAIAAIARQLNPRVKFEAFSVNYEEKIELDESKQAEEFANLLDFSFNRITISTQDFVRDFPSLVESLDEPTADPAAYSHFRIPKLAGQKGYKVLLNGIGGDEFFWGYYWLPIAVKENLKLIDAQNEKSLKSRVRSLFELSPNRTQKRKPNLFFYEALSEFNDVYNLKDACLTAKFKEKITNSELALAGPLPKNRSDVEVTLQKSLLETWLVSNCLNLSDRVGMYNAVETRMPFLDGDLTDYLLGLTAQGIATQFEGKEILKLAMNDLLPKPLLSRPKNGFRIPNSPWMRSLISNNFKELENGFLAGNGLLNIDNLRNLVSDREVVKWRHQFFLYKLMVVDGILQLNE